MKKHPIIFAIILLWTAPFCSTGAEITPPDAPLNEGNNKIVCELATAPKMTDCPAVLESKIDCEDAKGVYTYSVSVPPGYLENTSRRWPCVFILAAATSPNMVERLKSGYIVVDMVDDSVLGPRRMLPYKNPNKTVYPVVIGNFLAVHDDVMKRLRVQDGLKFFAGVGENARWAAILVQLRPGFSGMVLDGVGATLPVPVGYKPKQPGVYPAAKTILGGLRKIPQLYAVVEMAYLNTNKNKGEIDELKTVLSPQRVLAIDFKGGVEDPAPPEIFARAMDWLERQIYVDGPPQTLLKPAYMQYYNDLQAKLNAATSPWARFQLCGTIATFAQKRALKSEPSVAPSLGNVLAELAKLRTSPDIINEIKGADALRDLEARRAGLPPKMLGAACQDIINRFPNTEAAAKAREMAGLNLPTPTPAKKQP